MADLIGVRAKVTHAQRHFQALDDLIGRYLAQTPYETAAEVTEDGNWRVMKLTSLHPLPVDLALVLGDVVHNLRSALDHLACEAVEPKFVERAKFPIARGATGLTREQRVSLLACEMPGVKEPLRSALLETEPYVGGAGEYLWRLNELDRIDKHRLLLALASSTSIVKHEFDLPASAAADGVSKFRAGVGFPRRYDPLVVGAELFRVSARSTQAGAMTAEIQIVVAEPSPVDNRAALVVLGEMGSKVEELIDRVAPLIP